MYFSTVQYSDEHTFGGQTAVLSEPAPAPDARRLFPDELPTSAVGAFVCFEFFVLEAA